MASAPTGELVTIGCKHPAGVILNLDRYVRVGDASSRDVNRENGPTQFVLKGWSHEYNKADPTFDTGGYRLTNVPRDFWEQWLATHQSFSMLKDRTIIGPGIEAVRSDRDTPGKAKDHAAIPRMFGYADPATVGVKPLTKDD
jgi:hypothetical protein